MQSCGVRGLRFFYTQPLPSELVCPVKESILKPETTHPKHRSDTDSPDPEIPGFFICYADEKVRPSIHSPLERGIYRWVREQAFKAAHDPDREWHGAVVEYLRLREGTHPDPDPACDYFSRSACAL